MSKGRILYNESGVGMTAVEWAKVLNMSPSSVRRRAQLKQNVGSAKNSSNSKYRCPTTGSRMSIKDWAIYLGIDATTFKQRIRKWGENNPRVYTQHRLNGNPPPKLLHEVAKKKGQLFCRNPYTGESRLAWEWAKDYGISLAEINSAINDYGRNSRALYRHLESRKV